MSAVTRYTEYRVDETGSGEGLITTDADSMESLIQDLSKQMEILARATPENWNKTYEFSLMYAVTRASSIFERIYFPKPEDEIKVELLSKVIANAGTLAAKWKSNTAVGVEARRVHNLLIAASNRLSLSIPKELEDSPAWHGDVIGLAYTELQKLLRNGMGSASAATETASVFTRK